MINHICFGETNISDQDNKPHGRWTGKKTTDGHVD